MAFLISSSLILSVHMGRVSEGSSIYVVMVGTGLLGMSQKCSAHQSNFSSPLDNKVPSFALISPVFDLKMPLIIFVIC